MRPFKFVRVVFHIKKHWCFDVTTEALCVLPINYDGVTDREEAMNAAFMGLNMWFIEIRLPSSSKIPIKLALVDPRTNAIIAEESFVREFVTGKTPLLVEMTYNDPEVKTRELTSWLFESGNAFNISVHTPFELIADVSDDDSEEDEEMADCNENCATERHSEKHKLKTADDIMLSQNLQMPVTFVRVVFRVEKTTLDSTSGIVCVVPMSDSGRPMLSDVIDTSFTGAGTWFAEVGLPMNTVLKYKLGVKSPKDDSLLSKETVERELYLAETPVMLELSYDKPEVKTRAMKSCLSESGEPVNISVPLPNMKRQYRSKKTIQISSRNRIGRKPNRDINHTDTSGSTPAVRSHPPHDHEPQDRRGTPDEGQSLPLTQNVRCREPDVTWPVYMLKSTGGCRPPDRKDINNNSKSCGTGFIRIARKRLNQWLVYAVPFGVGALMGIAGTLTWIASE